MNDEALKGQTTPKQSTCFIFLGSLREGEPGRMKCETPCFQESIQQNLAAIQAVLSQPAEEQEGGVHLCICEAWLGLVFLFQGLGDFL